MRRAREDTTLYDEKRANGEKEDAVSAFVMSASRPPAGDDGDRDNQGLFSSVSVVFLATTLCE